MKNKSTSLTTAQGVAIYARKSTATEAKSRSVEEQIEFGRHFARSVGFPESDIHNYEEPEGHKGDWWWSDEAGVNPKPTRPVLGKLVRDIESGRIGTVFVWSTDRLHRDNGICDGLVKLFRRKGVSIYVKDAVQDITSAVGLYNTSTEAAANRMYRDKISEDVRRDHQFKAEMGKFSRDPSCLGFRSMGRESQAVRPMQGELEIVNRIFRLFVRGEGDLPPMGTTGIAKLLMSEGVSIAVGAKGHKARDPRRVHETQIATILRNCMYVARWRHNGNEYECDRLLIEDEASGERRTAVPTALFEVAQVKLASRTLTGRKRQSSPHLLSGLAICGSCGRPLEAKQKRRADGSLRHTYMCVPIEKKLRCSIEDVLGIQETILDSWVITSLLPYIQREMSRLPSACSNEMQDRLGHLKARLDDVRRRESEELPKLVGVLDAEQVGLVAKNFREEARTLQGQISLAEAQLAERPGNPEWTMEEVQRLPVAKLRSLLHRLIKWIAATGKGVLVCTQWDTFVAGKFETARLPGQRGHRSIGAAGPEAGVEAAAWIAHPECFVDGRRLALGAPNRHLRDEELLPGIDQLREELGILA